jgi:hypothetical protein
MAAMISHPRCAHEGELESAQQAALPVDDDGATVGVDETPGLEHPVAGLRRLARLPREVAAQGAVPEQRLRDVRCGAGGSVECELLGRAGERAELTGWSETELAAELWTADAGTRAVRPRRDAAGVFRLPVELGAGGWCRVRLAPRAG